MNDWCPVTERALDLFLGSFCLLKVDLEELKMKINIPYASTTKIATAHAKSVSEQSKKKIKLC